MNERGRSDLLDFLFEGGNVRGGNPTSDDIDCLGVTKFLGFIMPVFFVGELICEDANRIEMSGCQICSFGFEGFGLG